jgi:threonine dehydrogenase-like Zn-dependent dehydrogenase
MKAALLVGPGRIEIDEIATPDAGPGEVAVAVGGVGLCGSDFSVFSGAWKTPASPWVMGHEAFGAIEGVGDGVPADRIGETVVVEPNAPCLACDACRRGWTSACVARQSVGMNRQGALAERVIVPAPFAWPIEGVGATDLVCVEPSTVVHAALRRLGAELPGSALVVGVGAQGLLMSLALLDRGVAVHAFDLNPERVAFAGELGALSAGPADADRRFELVVDTVGSPASVEVAFGGLEVGGTLLFLGLEARPLGLTAQMLVRRQAILRGSLTYDHPDDFRSTIRLVSEGRFTPGRIVTDEYDLDHAQQAFERSASAVGKTWIRIGGGARES